MRVFAIVSVNVPEMDMIPTAVVGELKRPATVCVPPDGVTVCSENLPSSPIADGPGRVIRPPTLNVWLHLTVTRSLNAARERPPEGTSKVTSSRWEVAPPYRPACASGGGGAVRTVPV